MLQAAAFMDDKKREELFDTGVFNNYCKAYTYLAMKKAGVEPGIMETVMSELGEEFEMTSAAEALGIYRKRT